MIYLNILYIFDQNFTLVSTIKLLEFFDKNWETWKRLLCFWSIFWLFFLSSKVSKMKFNQKSLIYKNTTFYDIDFYQKIRILRFFFKKVSIDCFSNFSLKIPPKFHKILKKPTFWYTSIYYIFLIRILRLFQQSNY